MLKFWKINHERELSWNDDDANDFSTFIMIVAVRATEFGCSTHSHSNRKEWKVMLNKFGVIGHSTLNAISQFDVKTKTGVTCLKEGMPIIGTNALRTFIETNSHGSFTYMNLERILTAVDIANLKEQREETSSLGYPSP